MERKCPYCGTWNNDEDYCKNCGKLIDPQKLDEKETAERKKQRILLRKPGKLDVWLDKFSKSKNPFIKILYYITYSIWMVFSAIIGLILYLVAASPG